MLMPIKIWDRSCETSAQIEETIEQMAATIRRCRETRERSERLIQRIAEVLAEVAHG